MRKTVVLVCAVALIACGLPLAAQAEEEASPLYLKIGRGDMTLVGYTQLSYRFFEDDTDVGKGGFVYPANEEAEFVWDRIRLILLGHIVPQISYKFQWELAGTTGNKLRDGLIQFHLYPALDVDLTVGQWKIPFTEAGMLWVTTADELARGPMILEPIGNAHRLRDREFGVMLSARLWEKRFYGFAGVFNGTGYDQSDENDQKDFLIGFRLTPFPANVPSGRPNIANLLEGFQIGGAYMAGTEGAIGEQFSRERIAFTALYYKSLTPVDKLRLRTEWIHQTLDEHETAALFGAPEIKTSDWYILAAYRHADIELIARYDLLDNEDADLTYGQREAVTLGINYYINKFTKVRLNYGLYQEEMNSFDNNEGIVMLEVAF